MRQKTDENTQMVLGLTAVQGIKSANAMKQSPPSRPRSSQK